MARLFVVVEGETEEAFVNNVLAPHFYSAGFHAVSARLMGNARQRSHRGGIRPWPAAKRDILGHLRHDQEVFVTTMVDYYGMPVGTTNQRAWPGRTEAPRLPFSNRAACVEDAVAADIRQEMGASWNPRRFVPFVVIHEFEGLLFSDCAAFARGINNPEIEADLSAIRADVASPEEINDSPSTHPSVRVAALMPEYEKPLHGNLAALEVGLDAIRAECPHFRSWLERLEQLAAGSLR